MFKISFMFLFIAYSLVNIAQTNLNAEIERLKQNPDVKVEYLNNDRIQVNYGDFGKRIFYVGKNTNGATSTKEIPRFVFNVWELDTTQFAYKFSIWQEVPITTAIFNQVVGDINNNNKLELYGSIKDFNKDWSEVFGYEQNRDGIFKEAFKYPSNTILAKNIFDINNDNKNEFHILCTHYDSIWGGNVHDQTFFTQPNDDSLATKYFFDYNIYRGGGLYIQLNDFNVGDFDKDSINEAVFYNFMPPEIWVTKFNLMHLTFDSILAFPTKTIPGLGIEEIKGFNISDFDNDHNTDILFSSVYGNIYILENKGVDSYSLNWEGTTGVFNSYLSFITNDIDGNGKKEFWVGGQNLSENYSRLVCFEYTDDNQYIAVTEIEFTNYAALSEQLGGTIDIDNDGKEEIYYSLSNGLIILKYTGTPNNPNYEINFFKLFNYNVNGSLLYNNSNPLLFLSVYQSQNNDTKHSTLILKKENVSSVKEVFDNPFNFNLFNNYPNPFNSTTTIKFNISEFKNIKIIVYNFLGEEISILLNQALERGEHTVTWNGKDKNNNDVPSGIYFISLETNSFHKTIKTTLLK